MPGQDTYKSEHLAVSCKVYISNHYCPVKTKLNTIDSSLHYVSPWNVCSTKPLKIEMALSMTNV